MVATVTEYCTVGEKDIYIYDNLKYIFKKLQDGNIFKNLYFQPYSAECSVDLRHFGRTKTSIVGKSRRRRCFQLKHDSPQKFWFPMCPNCSWHSSQQQQECAYILKGSSQSSQKPPIDLHFPPKYKLRMKKLSSVYSDLKHFCHSQLNYIQPWC